MLRDVGQRLLQNAEQSQFRRVAQGGKGVRRLEVHLQVHPRAELERERAQRGHQAQVIEERRAQVVGQAADPHDPVVDQLQHAVEPGRVLGAGALAQQAELELHRREHLRRFVVQLEREAAALLLVLLDHAAGQPLQVRGARGQAAAQVVEHQPQNAAAHGQDEQDVEVVAPGVPRATRPQERVVEVVQAPQQQPHGQQPRPARSGPASVGEEDPRRPQGDRAEEQHRWPRGEHEVVEPVDRHVRPERREEQQRRVRPAPRELAREQQRGPQQRQTGPAREHLVPVEPVPAPGAQEADNGGQPEEVEPPRRRPPGEVRLAVAAVEGRAQQRQAQRDRGLE